MENESYIAKVPISLTRSMYFARAGRIAFRMSIPFAVLSVITAIAPAVFAIIDFLYWVVVAFLIILSLGSIFIFAPDILEGTSGGAVELGDTLGSIWYVAAPIALALAALSILFFLLDREYKHTSKIIVAAVIAVVQIIILIVFGVVGVTI